MGQRWVGVVVCVLALSACASEADKRMDALAKELAIPVGQVCPVPDPADAKEAGGYCDVECKRGKVAGRVHRLLDAATELGKIPASPDAANEQQLAPVRAAARAYVAEVTPACSIEIKRQRTAVADVETCADAAKTPGFEAREGDLREALATFLTAMPKGHGFAKPSRCEAPRR